MTVLTRFDEAGCGCGSVDPVNGLLAIDEAIARITQSVSQVAETEEVALADACGRILAGPVCANSARPAFDNSAMDGYALDSTSLTGAGPWRLDVTARIAAGQMAYSWLEPGTAAQIFTGAPIPRGADAVVMQEQVEARDGKIFLTRKPPAHAHIRAAGEELAAGAVVVPAGRRMTARGIAACAAAGVGTVRVRRRIRVALLVTGDEVTAPGQALNPAGIWDVNTPMLGALIAMPGIDLVAVDTGKDNRAALRQQLGRLAKCVDLIVTTGGISVGEEDHVRPALNDLGVKTLFSGVAMKPGKPVSFGQLASALWLGLPGNPLSAFVTWQLFGTVLCAALCGTAPFAAPRRRVVLGRALHHKYGRCELRLASISGFDTHGREVVVFEDATHSGRVTTLAEADGILLIPAEAEHLPEGALVEFQPFCD
ncbi:molybdopterin molybdenumtransferase MoeA [Jannaschia sp. EhC01]|nr:molybdopterin molybdenumtransferase MoeA [Jannaschia sp. EhC01]